MTVAVYPQTEEGKALVRDYNYIVVGAGSAGCAVAGRLAEAGHSILLFEADGRDHNSFIHIALRYSLLYANPAVIRCYSRNTMLRVSAHRPERIFVLWAIDAESVLRPCREWITPASQRPFA